MVSYEIAYEISYGISYEISLHDEFLWKSIGNDYGKFHMNDNLAAPASIIHFPRY